VGESCTVVMQCVTQPPEEPHPKLHRIHTYAHVINIKQGSYVCDLELS
jgi:hypothetical protein